MMQNKPTKNRKNKKNKKLLALSLFSAVSLTAIFSITSYFSNKAKKQSTYNIQLNNSLETNSLSDNNSTFANSLPSIPAINLTIRNDNPINIAQLDTNNVNKYNYDWWNTDMVNIFGENNAIPSRSTPINLDDYADNETVTKLKQLIKNQIVANNVSDLANNLEIKINAISTGFNGSVYLGIDVSVLNQKYVGGNAGDPNYNATITPEYINGYRKCGILELNGFKKYQWGTYSNETNSVTFSDEVSEKAFLNWKTNASPQITFSDSSFLPEQIKGVDQNSSDAVKQQFITKFVRNNWIYLLNISGITDGPAIYKSDNLEEDDSTLNNFLNYLSISTPTFSEDVNSKISMSFAIAYPSGLTASFGNNEDGSQNNNIVTQLDFSPEQESIVNVGPGQTSFSNPTVINQQIDVQQVNLNPPIDTNITIDDFINAYNYPSGWRNFVASNANVIFRDGYDKISHIQAIKEVRWSKEQGANSTKELKLTIVINANYWYNNDGLLGNTENTFSTTITGFKKTSPTSINSEIGIDSLDKTINPSINANTTLDDFIRINSANGTWINFVAQNANTLFSAGYEKILNHPDAIKEVRWKKVISSNTVSDSQIELYIDVNSFYWYNNSGDLGTDVKTFAIRITGFKTSQKTVIATTPSITSFVDPTNSNQPFASSTTVDDLITKNNTTNSGWINFVAQNANVLFSAGYDKILNTPNAIKEVKWNKIANGSSSYSDSQIALTITINPEYWYESDGNYGSTEQTFNVTIQGFKTSKKTVVATTPSITSFVDPTNNNQPFASSTTIDDLITKNNTTNSGWINFVAQNANVLFTSGYDKILNTPSAIKEVSWNKIPNGSSSYSDSQIALSITINPEYWYSSDGNYGSTEQTFKVTIQGFKTSKKTVVAILPSITSFVDPTNNNQPFDPTKTTLDDFIAKNEKANFGWINFVAKNANVLFTSGYDKILNNFNAIKEVRWNKIANDSSSISDSQIALTITINPEYWYSSDGNYGNIEQTFNVTIQGFKTSQKTVIKPSLNINELKFKGINYNNDTKIDNFIKSINDNNGDGMAWIDFVAQNANVLFTSGYDKILNSNAINRNAIKEVKWERIQTGESISDSQIALTITINPEYWYISEGNLGTNEETFNVTIQGFKTSNNPTSVKTEINIDVFGPSYKNTTIDDFINQNNKNNEKNWIDFVVNNAKEIFTSGYEQILDNPQAIKEVNWKIIDSSSSDSNSDSNKIIQLVITINAGYWYESPGNLSKTPQSFSIGIRGFQFKNNDLNKWLGMGLSIGGGVLLLIFMIVLLVKKSKLKNDPDDDETQHIEPQRQDYTMMNLSMYDPATGEPNDPYYAQYDELPNTYEYNDPNYYLEQNPYMNDLNNNNNYLLGDGSEGETQDYQVQQQDDYYDEPSDQQVTSEDVYEDESYEQ